MLIQGWYGSVLVMFLDAKKEETHVFLSGLFYKQTYLAGQTYLKDPKDTLYLIIALITQYN